MYDLALHRRIDAAPKTVWNVLADFPGIADWNDGIKKSYSTNGQAEGVGAKRHCDLAPMGQLEETVREWVPEQRLVVDIDEAKGLPIKKGVATFTMKQAAADATDFTLEYEYSALPIVGAAMRRQLAKGFSGFLDSLERAALTG